MPNKPNKEENKAKKEKKHKFKDFKAELKKVIWPTPKQLINNTITVIAMVLITAVIVFALDFVFGFIVEHGIEGVKSAVSSEEATDTENTESTETTEGTQSSEQTVTAVEGNEVTVEVQPEGEAEIETTTAE